MTKVSRVLASMALVTIGVPSVFLIFSMKSLTGGVVMGYFFGGPIFCIGSLVFLTWVAWKSSTRRLGIETDWYIGIWLLLLAYYYLLSNSHSLHRIVALLAVALSLGAGFYAEALLRRRLSRLGKILGVVLVITAATMFVMCVVPPVMEPYWGKKPRHTIDLPRYAIFTDSRFDASAHMPDYAVDRNTIALQWGIVAFASGIACLTIVRAMRTDSRA